MPSEIIGEYEIEYSGVQLAGTDDWAAYVAIYGPSTSPLHRNSIVPTQRVAVTSVFPTQEAAVDEARKVAISMLEEP